MSNSNAPKPPTPQRDDLLPGRPTGMRRGLVLAVIAHVVLILALAIGVNWQTSEPTGASAELWATTPQAAGPQAAVEPPPPPPPEVKPPPPPQVDPPSPPPKPIPDPQIAIEKEKERKEKEKKKKAEEEAEQREKEKLRKEKEKKDQQLKREQQQLQAEKAREEKEKKEAEQKKKQQETDRAKTTEAQMERVRKLLGDSGSSEVDGTGKDNRNAGPSAGYGGRVVAAVRPNIVLTGDIAGNPTAEVEVRSAPDGVIVGRRIVKSSGVAEWDEAVMRAIDRTQKMPRDADGRVHSPIVIAFRPRDL